MPIWIVFVAAIIAKSVQIVIMKTMISQPDNTIDGEVRVQDALNGLRREMPEYKAWEQMKQRCRNTRYSTWKNYGGRGIKVCDEWLNDFPAFYEHIGPKPQPYDKHSLDRINNDGNYEPGNVRWATRYQQQKNRRLHKDNKSGASGITWSDKKNGWSVFDFRDDKSHYIGFYPLLGKAIDALVEYRVKLELAQEANKARLDEVKMALNWFTNESGYLFYLDDRLKALTADKEQ